METDYSVEINSSIYDRDLDEVGWDPEVIDDSDNESADIFGFNN